MLFNIIMAQELLLCALFPLPRCQVCSAVAARDVVAGHVSANDDAPTVHAGRASAKDAAAASAATSESACTGAADEDLAFCNISQDAQQA